LKGAKHINFVYPAAPHEHIMPVNESKRPVGRADYRFEDTRFWYQVLAGVVRAAAWVVFPVWAFLWMRTRINGRKNFRALRGQGIIVVANHVHILDAPVLGACATRTRKLRIITLKENMNLPLAGRIMKLLGCIPLGADYGGMKKLTKTVDSLLARKKPVLFYPEAAFWPYYTGLRPFTTGGFSFAVKNNVPVLPTVYTFGINKRGIKNRLVLHILPAIVPAVGESAEQLSLRAYEAMLKISHEFYADKRNNKSGHKVEIEFGEPQA